MWDLTFKQGHPETPRAENVLILRNSVLLLFKDSFDIEIKGSTIDNLDGSEGPLLHNVRLIMNTFIKDHLSKPNIYFN